MIDKKKYRILVVDDEKSNRTLFRDMLGCIGYDIETAADGHEALEKIGPDTDLVLLDIMMPRKNGFEVLKEIKSTPALSHIPVIIISAVSERENIIKGIELGAEDFLPKPFDVALLRARISSGLAQKKLWEQEQYYIARLRQEQKKANDLLLNILPGPIADRLKDGEHQIADEFKDITVLFADIVNFTVLSAQASPSKVLAMLNSIFTTFDDLTDRFGLEKIKTIGDAYMVAGGLPIPRPDHVGAVAGMALEMQNAVAAYNKATGSKIAIRIGIDTGPAIAGVIGKKKFTYDVWGDTINTASRMESSCPPGRIQVTAAVFERLKDRFLFVRRGRISLKGKGNVNTYHLLGHRKRAGKTP